MIKKTKKERLDEVKNRSQIGYYSSSLKDYQVWRKCM